ncbi:MAG: metallophosphoesterase family protein [Chloroflexi bacterium]|nr:metallophosphoesterase family protein [Chloroflexota bacterium]
MTHMRIGVISDTHIPKVTSRLPEELTAAFQGVDLILHAGDIFAPSVLDDLERIAPVLAARGDDDEGPIAADRRVKDKHILRLAGRTLWLVHDKPYAPRSPKWLANWWQNRLKPEQDEYGKPDIIIFGHEHRTFKQHIDGVLFFSSGSATFPNYVSEPGTIGILELGPDTTETRILQL